MYIFINNLLDRVDEDPYLKHSEEHGLQLATYHLLLISIELKIKKFVNAHILGFRCQVVGDSKSLYKSLKALYTGIHNLNS